MNSIVVDDDKMCRVLIEEFIGKSEGINLTGSFSNAIDAINAIRMNDSIDLIFLDIEMPQMTGIDFLNSLDNPIQVIIISSKEKYALNAFDYDVTDYLLKPITFSRFNKAVDKALTRYKREKLSSESKDEIFIKKGSSLVRIKYNEILWIEALENYVILNTATEKLTIHFTMKAIEKKLPSKKFIRIHRSFIVNTSKVSVIQDNAVEIKLKGQTITIPIGKSYKEQLMKDINLMVK